MRKWLGWEGVLHVVSRAIWENIGTNVHHNEFHWWVWVSAKVPAALPTLNCLQNFYKQINNPPLNCKQAFFRSKWSLRSWIPHITSHMSISSRIFFCFDSKLKAAKLGSMQPCLGSTSTHLHPVSLVTQTIIVGTTTWIFFAKLTRDTSFFVALPEETGRINFCFELASSNYLSVCNNGRL